jgi:predicted transcriptional regulator
MPRGAVTAEEDTPIEKLARAMERRNIRRIPVLRDDRPVGTISRADLIRALLHPPEDLAADAPDERIRPGSTPSASSLRSGMASCISTATAAPTR